VTDVREPICFHCGQAFEGRFNHLPDGRPCPLCTDRLMESLPPLLPFDARAGDEGPVADEAAEEGRGEPAALAYLRPVPTPPEPA